MRAEPGVANVMSRRPSSLRAVPFSRPAVVRVLAVYNSFPLLFTVQSPIFFSDAFVANSRREVLKEWTPPVLINHVKLISYREPQPPTSFGPQFHADCATSTATPAGRKSPVMRCEKLL